GGEVERILRMVDGFLLLVDAAEGPMPQTRFVAGKALALGLKPIVLVNKIDRQDAEPLRVHDEVLELFLDLEATPEQFNCPFLYTSSRAGTATLDLKSPGTDLNPLFQTILDTIPAPRADPDGPFQMLVSTLDYSSYLGRIAIGRIERGHVRVGETVALLPLGEPGPLGDGSYEQARVVKLFSFDGRERVEVPSIDCPGRYRGVAVERLGPRRAELLDMRNPGVGTVRMRFKIPARGLLGYRSEFLTDTRGTGIMHHRFFDYGPWAGPLQGRSRGVLVADREGVAVGYALFNLQERGTMFVKPGDPVYEGMVVGENARGGDMDVNPAKE